MTEEKTTKNTIFAVRTTIGRERTVQDLIFNRLRTIVPLPDLKAILTTEMYRGYVFVEAVHQRDVVHITNGLPHVKGKVVGSIPFDSISSVIQPEKSISYIEEGDIVEITSGVFQNQKAQVTTMVKEGTRDDVTVRLLDSDSPITVKIHSDFLKLLEKTKKVTKQYVLSSSTETKNKPAQGDGSGTKISESAEPSEEQEAPAKVIMTEEEVGASMDDKFSFDEDEEEFEEEFEEEEHEEDYEDEEYEEDDDWAKFF